MLLLLISMQLVALILSDVIGDPLETIASGPTVPNHTPQQDVIRLLDKYQLVETVPASIMSHLRNMEEIRNDADVPAISKQYVNIQNVLVGTNQIATKAAQQTAQSFGYSSFVWSHSVRGEARKLGELFAVIAHNLLLKMEGKLVKFPEICFSNFSEDVRDDVTRLFLSYHEIFDEDCRKICLISGGEPTVTVKGNGKGGRNQELALSFAIHMQKLRSSVNSCCSFASVGTDGQDGPCDAAGALVDETVVENSLGQQKLDPVKFLENNDSYTFFSKLNNGRHLIRTGLTGTNVMDVHALLLTVS